MSQLIKSNQAGKKGKINPRMMIEIWNERKGIIQNSNE